MVLLARYFPVPLKSIYAKLREFVTDVVHTTKKDLFFASKKIF